MSTLAQTYWTYTCKFCDVVRKVLATAFVAIIAFGENAGSQSDIRTCSTRLL